MEITPRCQRAIDYAKNVYPRFGHAHMSSAHLVLGLLALRTGVAVNILMRGQIEQELVEQHLSGRPSSSEDTSLENDVVVGKSVANAIARAKAEAERAHHTYLGTEHLLLGLLAEESGAAAELFDSLFFNKNEARDLLLAELK